MATDQWVDIFLCDPKDLALRAFQMEAKQFARLHGCKGLFRAALNGYQFRMTTTDDGHLREAERHFLGWHSQHCAPLYETEDRSAHVRQVRAARDARENDILVKRQERHEGTDGVDGGGKRKTHDEGKRPAVGRKRYKAAEPTSDAEPMIIPVLTLRERWDPTALDMLMRTHASLPASETSPYRGLPNMNALDANGCISVGYGWPHDAPTVGRWRAAGASAQKCSGLARRFGQHAFYHDIDQVNSGPAILISLCKQLGISCPVLQKYVEKRDEHLDALSKANKTISREQAKKAFQKIMYGCAVPSWAAEAGLAENLWAPLNDFAAEVQAVRKQLLQGRLGEKYRQKLKGAEDDNDLSLFSRIIQDHERQAVEAMISFFGSQGYTVGVYVYDGLQVERRGPGPMDTAVLRQCEAFITSCTGLCVQLTEKPFQPTAADLQALRDSTRVLRNETDAAREVLLHRGDLVAHTPAGLALFETTWGTYSLDAGHNERIVLATLMRSLEHRMQGDRQHFLNECRARHNVMQMLPSLMPLDYGWLDVSAERERFKLCFSNGYWDFNEHRFCEGSFPEHRFLTGVRAPLMPRDQRQVDLVLEEIFDRPYSNVAVRDYVLKALARALAGDQAAKQGYFILGPSNSGKGMLTRLLEVTFPGLVSQFNASHLCAHNSNDPSKDFQWVVPIFHCRIIVANEFNLDAGGGRTQRVNSNIWKSVVSGGTDRIECRLLHQNSVKVIPRFTPFILANDMPEFDNPSDSGTQTRTVATYMDRCSSATEGPAMTDQFFRADPSLCERILRPEYQNGLIWLLFDYFERYRREGHAKPDAIRAATAERVPTDGVWTAITDTLEVWSEETQARYRTTAAQAVQDGWSVRTSAVYEVLQKAQIMASQAAVVKHLATRGVIKHKTRADGQHFVGLRYPGAHVET